MIACVEHQGYTMPNGYGQVRRDGKTWLAHRWVAYIAHGPCPPGQVVRHKCDNRLCIEPTHLEYGTQGQNLDDRKQHGHVYRKLDAAMVQEIRVLLSQHCTLASIGRKFGVSSNMVGHIRDGKQWSDI